MLCRRALAWLFAVTVGVACAGRAPLPAKAITLNDEGAAALAAGQLDVADSRLALALEYNDRFVEAWVNVGVLATLRGDFKGAEHSLRRALKLNPDLPAPHHAMGQLAERRGDKVRAIGHYRAALAVDPGFFSSRANLGRLLFEDGRYQDAREQFARLVEIAPEQVASWSGLCESMLRLGLDDAAADVLARARVRFGGVDSLQVLSAREALRRSEFAFAESLLAPVARSRSGEAARAWAWIGYARAGRGDPVGARAAVESALTLDASEQVATQLRQRLMQVD